MKLFEECDPRPTEHQAKGMKDVERMKFGGTTREQKEAKALVNAFGSVLCEDLTKAARVESKAPLFRIDLKEGFRERRTRSRPLRRRSAEEDQAIKDFVDTMVNAGMIEKCTVPQAASLVLVRQKSKIRICVDFRELNSGTIVDQYPQACADEILSSFHGAKYFSTLDATSGYWQVGIEEASRSLTAFKTKYGTYMWNRLPFGLINAPAHYNRWMEQVLEGLPVFRYVDDIIIATKTWNEHMELLEQVLIRCKDHGVKLKPSKCHIGKQEVEVLGHVVNEDGIRPVREKVSAILDMPAPRTAKELKTFMGCVSFYRRYCSNLASITSRMRALLKKGVKYVWTSELQKEFEATKKLLTSEEIMLAHPDSTKPFYIHVDASKKGIGACLMQETGMSNDDEQDATKGEKNLRVVEYFSVSLKDGEKNYGITELEGLGIVKAVEKWHPYIYGGELIVVTDHKPLLAMNRSNNARLVRWSLRMAPYAFQLRWKAGETHGAPDALSRAIAPTGGVVSSSLSVTVNKTDRKVTDDMREAYVVAMKIAPISPRRHINAIRSIEEDDEENSSVENAASNTDSTQEEEEDDGDLDEREKAMEDEIRRMRIIRETSSVKRSWKKMQEEDAQCRQMKGTVIKNGLLVRKEKIVVPTCARRIVLHLAHGNGHEGVNATQRNLKGFYWPKMKESIRRWIKGCKCAHAKMTRRPDGLTKIFDGYRALQAIVVDYMVDTVQHSRNTKNARYVLMMVDRATGYCRMGLTKSRSAADTAMAIKTRWIQDFGCPEIIMSDNERAMTSELTSYLCRAAWMSKLIFFAPYQKTGGGMVERAIQNAETKIRSSIAAGDIAEDGANMESWIKDIEWNVNTCEKRDGSSAFERLYGTPPRTPLRMAIPISINMTEAERKRWQTSLRARVEDNRVREAMRMLKRKQRRSKASLKFKKGMKIWVRQEGTGISAINPQRWQRGIFLRYRDGERSAIVSIEGRQQQMTRRLESIRRRHHQNNVVPNDDEIEAILIDGNNQRVEETDPEEDASQKTGVASQEEEEDNEVELSPDDEKEVKGTRVEESDQDNQNYEMESSESELNMVIPATQPASKADDDAQETLWSRRKRKQRRSKEGSSKRKQKQVKTAQLPLTQKEVVVVQDRSNNSSYLSLLNEANGKFIILKRTRGKNKRAYHPVWWKNNPNNGRTMQRAQMKHPGDDWHLWECSQEMMEEKARFGAVLGEDYRLPPEFDNKYLQIAGIKQRQA